jgi:hypothetical protein
LASSAAGTCRTRWRRFCRSACGNQKFALPDPDAERPSLIERELQEQARPAGSWTITQVGHERIGSFLAAADFALSFIEAAPSKIASSPTKIGEYLAAGLPVVCNPGWATSTSSWKSSTSASWCPTGAGTLLGSSTGRAAMRAATGQERCRGAARATTSLEEIGVPRYDRLYRAIATRATQTWRKYLVSWARRVEEARKIS